MNRRGDRLAPLLLGALLGALVAGRLATALGCLGIALAGAWLAGAPRPGWRWLTGIGLSMVLAVVLNGVLTPGHPLPMPFGGHLSGEGLRYGGLLALRLAGAGVALLALRAAWPGERAADELARRLAPLERLRVPVAESRVVLGLAVRFAPLLATESRRIARRQDLRAGGPPRDWGERLVRRRAVMVPLMVSALERAERVGMALEARHYDLRPVSRGRGASWGWDAAGLGVAAVSLLWRR